MARLLELQFIKVDSHRLPLRLVGELDSSEVFEVDVSVLHLQQYIDVLPESDVAEFDQDVVWVDLTFEFTCNYFVDLLNSVIFEEKL